MSQSEVTPVYGATNPGPQDTAHHSIKRFGSVIGLEPDKEQYYRQLHVLFLLHGTPDMLRDH